MHEGINQDAIKHRQFRAVVYAQRTPYERPIPMTVDLRPFHQQPTDGVEFLQLAQPIPSAAAFQQPMPPQQRPADPTNLDFSPPKKEFTCGIQFLSGFLLLWSFGMATTAFVFYMFVITDTVWNDYFSTTLSRISCYVGSFVFGVVVLIRLTQGCLTGSGSNIAERFAGAASIICPGLKYHVARLNPKFEGKIRSNLSVDIICDVLQIIAGVLFEVAAGNSYYVRWWYQDGTPYYVHDALPLLCGIFLLVESLFLFSMEILIHGKWISNQRKDEKTKEILENGMLQYRMDGPYGPIYRQID